MLRSTTGVHILWYVLHRPNKPSATMATMLVSPENLHLHSVKYTQPCPQRVARHPQPTAAQCVLPSAWYATRSGVGHYPTPGCENQWIWVVVSKAVDTTGPNLHIGYNTLISITVARERTCSWMPYLATLDLLLMLKVNGVFRLYVSFKNPLLYWLHNAVCSKYSLDKIAKREIIKRLFCHVIHGDMTSQLDITWQRGETIAKYLFISIWKLANGMAQNHISGVNLSALYA